MDLLLQAPLQNPTVQACDTPAGHAKKALVVAGATSNFLCTPR